MADPLTAAERDAAIAALERVQQMIDDFADDVASVRQAASTLQWASRVIDDEIARLRDNKENDKMKTIDEHKVNPVNDLIEIVAVDEPEHGAHHHYEITASGTTTTLVFQRGPIAEHGINGLTNEALLAVVLDRLRDFQQTAFACKENACAITHIEEAMHWLHARTRKRMAAGTEGTSKV